MPVQPNVQLLAARPKHSQNIGFHDGFGYFFGQMCGGGLGTFGVQVLRLVGIVAHVRPGSPKWGSSIGTLA